MYIKLIIISVVAFMLASCRYDDGYRIEGNKVFYEHQWNEGSGTKISELDADVATFQVLGNDNVSWAKDKDKVWWGYMVFNNMDSATFEVLSISMAKDKYKVICGNRVMKEANPTEFKVIAYINKKGDESIYGVDKHGAFLCSQHPNGYSYLQSESIESFQGLEDYFFKDNEKVWSGSKVLPTGVDILNFEVLTEGYATDGKHIYFHSRIIQGADPATFKVIGSMYAQDKNYRYNMERRIQIE